MFQGATFGPFELDIQSRELRKHGIRLRLPEQSLEILSLLAARQGEIVTREEIRDRLWPNGTVVDYEHSINAALKRLRDALGDSAAQPRYIETLSRRGYVFIAPVQFVEPGFSPRFHLLEESGRGAMGVVYRAEDLRLGRVVALKFLSQGLAADAYALERLRREARTAASLNHPNICTLHGLEEHEGRPCLVMEFLDGRPLSQLTQSGPLPWRQALEYAIQACQALEAAHARGVVHRDLKPANLFVTGSGVLKLMDFGIAVRSGDTGEAKAGTPCYMSPEQVRGEAPDGRSDIFSLGAVLRDLMPGSAAAAPVVARCMRDNPADRFQTAAELRTALESLRREPEAPDNRLRRRWILVAAAAALLLCAAGVVWRLGVFAGDGRPAIRSIAVLPLANLSADPGQEYFADGMTDQLITELAQIRGWKIISRTSVMRYKGTRRPVHEIASDLGVDGVLEGTVLRSGNQVRITAQLIDARTDGHLWSGSFERDLSDVLALQASVAEAISSQLSLNLTPQQQARSNARAKMIPEAYDAYLRGWYNFDRSQYQQAASHFDRATRIDPAFGLAWALLGESEGMSAFARDELVSQRGLQAFERARQLDPNLAEVHALSGDALFGNREFEAGLAEYRRAAELDPGSVDAVNHYVIGLHALTRWQTAEQELRRALRMDPVSPQLNVHMVRLLVDTHRNDLALEQFRSVIELDPASAAAYAEIWPAYDALGRTNEAIDAFLKSESLAGGDAGELRPLAEAARQGGLRGCLRKRVEQLEEAVRLGHVSPVLLAGLYARLGDREHALGLLETAYEQKRPRLMWIKARAVWDPLRAEPRFQALLRRMRFPE